MVLDILFLHLHNAVAMEVAISGALSLKKPPRLLRRDSGQCGEGLCGVVHRH